MLVAVVEDPSSVLFAVVTRRVPSTRTSGRSPMVMERMPPDYFARSGEVQLLTLRMDAIERRMDNLARADETALIGKHSEYPHNDANFIAKNDKGVTVNRWNTSGFLLSSAASNEAGYLSVKMLRALGVVTLDTQARI